MGSNGRDPQRRSSRCLCGRIRIVHQKGRLNADRAMLSDLAMATILHIGHRSLANFPLPVALSICPATLRPRSFERLAQIIRRGQLGAVHHFNIHHVVYMHSTACPNKPPLWFCSAGSYVDIFQKLGHQQASPAPQDFHVNKQQHRLQARITQQ